jgi:EAL domain-containing protein (putative c-di-GMP-specific phosphodiesterase class I)
MDAVDRFDVPGECIEIVLTGKTDLLDRSLLELNFEHVRHAGISITLDDFPVAESSFLQLAEYKFDKVKFSKALMPSLSDSVAIWSKKRELLNILAAAAKSIGVSVVLTGVDREAHFNFFRELAVDEWQGRYFGDVGQLSDMDTRINATHFL